MRNLVCPHCPSYPITKEELGSYQEEGYFMDMKVGELLYASSLCLCYDEKLQDCDCEGAALTQKLIRRENVKVCNLHRESMLQMMYPESMLVLVPKDQCEFEEERLPKSWKGK